MELSERKQKILKAIVDLYIRSAEPVGSKTIAALPDMDFSSATIRNEMAELTSMGFLEQPHTSAGRIPSPAGYRFYIDRLMQDYRLSVDETQSINQAMEMRMQEFDRTMSKVGKLVSQLTNLPAYAMTSHTESVKLRRFEILPADRGSFILVVMASDETVKNKLIKLPLNVTEADLKLLSAVLNASLTEITAEQFTPELIDRVSRSAGAASGLVPIAVDFADHALHTVADIEAGHDDGGVFQLLGHVFRPHQDLQGAVGVELGRQLGDGLLIQGAQDLLGTAQVLIFRLAQQTVLTRHINLAPAAILQQVRREIHDDRHQARRRARASAHAIQGLRRELLHGKLRQTRVQHRRQEL